MAGVADLLDHLPALRRERNQPRDLAFGVHPAQPVDEPEQLELRRVIADQARSLCHGSVNSVP